MLLLDDVRFGTTRTLGNWDANGEHARLRFNARRIVVVAKSKIVVIGHSGIKLCRAGVRPIVQSY
jgi:hypothetical protein